jgi:hypothetical protein
MLCVTTMAREGGHATCSVKRGTVFDCEGPVKRVPWVGLSSPPQADEPSRAAPPPKPAASAAPSPAQPQDPPQTMVEFAKRTNEQTVEQMKKAGESVSKAGETMKEATKKTWDCMVSLFTRC